MTVAGRAGGDLQAVVTRYNEQLATFEPQAKIIAGRTDAPLTAECNGVDPTEPLRNALAFNVIISDNRTITIGLDGPYNSSCGPALSVLWAIGR